MKGAFIYENFFNNNNSSSFLFAMTINYRIYLSACSHRFCAGSISFSGERQSHKSRDNTLHGSRLIAQDFTSDRFFREDLRQRRTPLFRPALRI